MAFSPSRIFYVFYEEGGAYCLWKGEWKKKGNKRKYEGSFFVKHFK